MAVDAAVLRGRCGQIQVRSSAFGLVFIPYGVTVDEFQHFVYANPDATPTERKKAWRNIEKTYLPHINYKDNQYLGAGWFLA